MQNGIFSFKNFWLLKESLANTLDPAVRTSLFSHCSNQFFRVPMNKAGILILPISLETYLEMTSGNTNIWLEHQRKISGYVLSHLYLYIMSMTRSVPNTSLWSLTMSIYQLFVCTFVSLWMLFIHRNDWLVSFLLCRFNNLASFLLVPGKISLFYEAFLLPLSLFTNVSSIFLKKSLFI